MVSFITETRYFVLYRTGGTDWCAWIRLPAQYTKPAADAKRAELLAMGYKALVQSVEQLRRIGMPYGWEANSVDWEQNQTATQYDVNGIPWRTEHTKQARV